MNTFEVLADQNRRRILEYLREEERPVGDVVRALGISQPGVSKHLRVLRRAGLVSVRPDAQRRMYRVPRHLAITISRGQALLVVARTNQ